MTVVKQAVFLLLLLAVAIYADHHGNHSDHNGDHADHKAHADHAADDHHHDHADPAADDHHHDHADPDDCANLNRELQTKDLHKAFGRWVLVHSVASDSEGADILENATSSRIEVHLNPDNKTISYKEWNKFRNGSCINYFLKLSLVENRADEDHHILPVSGYHVEEDGGVSWHNHTGEIHFYQTHDDLLQLVYKVEGQQFLLNYRKEGTHKDATLLRADDDQHDRQAKCLKFSHERAFRYDGAEDFCENKTPELPHHDHDDHHRDHHDHHDDAKQAEASA